MAITKPNTSTYKHYISLNIKAIQVSQDHPHPLIAFMGGPGEELILPMTDRAWRRAGKGQGATHPALRNEIVGASRFRFSVMTEPNPTKGARRAAGRNEIVTGVHCFPNNNYMAADFSVELQRLVDPGAAIVTVHEESGELDVIAYPLEFRSVIENFVAALEELETIDNYTTFTIRGVQFSVSTIAGSEVTFRCAKTR